MKRNQTFDVIKGVCCLFVIATHFDWSLAEYNRLGFAFWLYLPIPLFMMISGYVGALSAEKNGGSLSAQYRPEVLGGKMLRFLVPYTVAFLVEQFYSVLKLDRTLGFLQLLKLYLTGGVGPGSYYTPIVLQFIFVFPLIFILIKRKGYHGLLICAGINATYELLKWAYGMDEGCYRVLVFRYILLIGFGCYLALFTKRISLPVRLGAFVIGTSFIIAYQYLGYEPVFLNMRTDTCILSALYIMPLFDWVYHHCHFRCQPLELLGKASYNCYLAQMVYYSYGMDFVYLRVTNRWAQLTANLLVCSIAGIVFYLLETPVTRRLRKMLVQRLAVQSDTCAVR